MQGPILFKVFVACALLITQCCFVCPTRQLSRSSSGFVKRYTRHMISSHNIFDLIDRQMISHAPWSINATCIKNKLWTIIQIPLPEGVSPIVQYVTPHSRDMKLWMIKDILNLKYISKGYFCFRF